MGDSTHTGSGFGARLKELRGRAGLSQAQLARAAKMNTSGVSKLEQGVTEPSFATALGLAAALHVSVADFAPSAPLGGARRVTPPVKVVLPGEGRLDAATAILRTIQDASRDITHWGVLADWLGDRGLQAEHYCRRRVALLEHTANRPDHHIGHRGRTPERKREERRERIRAWEAEGADIERRFGPETRGGYADRPVDVLWVLWGDPFTPPDVRADLYLHHCRATANPRALVGWLLGALPERGGPLYASARELVRRYAAGEGIPDGCPEYLRGNALRDEGHYSAPAGGHDVRVTPAPYSEAVYERSAVGAVSDLVDAIFSADPIRDLFGDHERAGEQSRRSGIGDRGKLIEGDALAIRSNPFAPPQ